MVSLDTEITCLKVDIIDELTEDIPSSSLLNWAGILVVSGGQFLGVHGEVPEESTKKVQTGKGPQFTPPDLSFSPKIRRTGTMERYD